MPTSKVGTPRIVGTLKNKPMDDTIEQIEIARLRVLERQAALTGPQTAPHILIEIAELKSKARNFTSEARRAFVTTLDFQFVMDVVAAALVRLGQVEANQASDKQSRWIRQTIHDVFMIIVLIALFAQFLLIFLYR